MIKVDKDAKNVLGLPLEPCSLKPLTGYYRDGYCNSLADNLGKHVVCIYATKEFLEFSKSVGNDLTTPIPEMDFEGVKVGQSWCLSGYRWLEAYQAGVAPPIFIYATHKKMLELVPLDILKEYALDL